MVDNSGVVGETKGVSFLDDGIPVSGMAGDQQAALFGQACFTAGMAKCTYGTGAFVLMNTGTDVVYSNHGLLTTVAWRLNGTVSYALEGSAFIAGAAVQWLRDNLQIISSAAEIEAWPKPNLTMVGCLCACVCWFGCTSLGSRGQRLFHGITGGTQKGHLHEQYWKGSQCRLSTSYLQ